jgi:hypothetical protein
MDVGRSGSAGEVVWIAYGDLGEFNAEGNEESGIVKAVRCSADLASCTAPITNSSVPPTTSSSPASPPWESAPAPACSPEIGDDRSRFADTRAVKAHTGAAPVTRASGKRRQVLAREVKTND